MDDLPRAERVLAALEAERRALLAKQPDFVLSVDNIRAPRAVVQDDHLVYPCPNDGREGPWVLDAIIQGPAPNEAAGIKGWYDSQYRVRLYFTHDYIANYPKKPPAVKFLNIIHHFYVGEDRAPPPMFYQVLETGAGVGDPSLRGTLEGLFSFLAVPLHPCANCDRKFDAVGEYNKERLDTIAQYRPLQLHPQLFDNSWLPAWFDPRFRSVMCAEEVSPSAVRGLCTEVNPGIFTFPMFTEDFCRMFLEETDHFYASGLPVRRPNSMNNYGIIVNEIGMEHMIDVLQAKFLQVIGAALFGPEGQYFDGHHSFMVQYKPGEDLGLDLHIDDSDVTFNICLGKEFTGAGLTFCGNLGAADHRKQSYVYSHVKGQCVVHLGRRRHGADDIVSGERRNLIIWNHGSAWRSTTPRQELDYRKEESAPDLQCLSYTHDRDYGVYKQYPTGREKFQGHGWCPPEGSEYDGFKEESFVAQPCDTCA